MAKSFGKTNIESEKKMISVYMTNRIIQHWCNETERAASFIANQEGQVVQLFTKDPGIFIGKGGFLVSKYREKLRAIGWNNVYVVELHGVLKPMSKSPHKKDKTEKEVKEEI